jgi:hypothetical protein
MAGLIGVGRNTLGQASVGFQQSAGLEANRNAAQQQLNAARAAQRSSMVSTGAGLGGSIGVNNLMAANAAAKAGTTVAAGTTAASAAPAVLTPAIQAAVPATALTSTGGFVGTSTALGAGAGTTAGMTTLGAAGAAAAPAAAAPVAVGGASTGALAGIGAIATPLLIGAGAALLLDSLFDIF